MEWWLLAAVNSFEYSLYRDVNRNNFLTLFFRIKNNFFTHKPIFFQGEKMFFFYLFYNLKPIFLLLFHLFPTSRNYDVLLRNLNL